MEALELWVANTGFAAIINTLTFLFADQLKGYASQKIAKHLDEHMGILIAALNTAIGTCVPLLQRLGWKLPQLPLDTEELAEAVEVTEAEAEAITLAKDLDWPVIDWADPGR